MKKVRAKLPEFGKANSGVRRDRREASLLGGALCNLTGQDFCPRNESCGADSSMTDEPGTQFFQVRTAGKRSVIEFDSSIAEASNQTEEIRSELSEFLFANDCGVLIIDLTGTKFLPSSVLGVLTVICKGGTELHLVNAPDEVVDVMQVTKLDSMIHVNEIQLPPRDDSSAVTAVSASASSKNAAVLGYFVPCPHCGEEQKIDKHLLGDDTRCDDCRREFHVRADLLQSATYLFVDCPHCRREIRFARKYLAKPVACNFCDGVLQIRMYV